MGFVFPNMRLYGTFAFLFLLMTTINSVRVGLSSAAVARTFSRNEFAGVADVPRLEVLRRVADPRHLPSYESDSSPLVARTVERTGEEKELLPPKKRFRSSSSSHEPTNAQASSAQTASTQPSSLYQFSSFEQFLTKESPSSRRQPKRYTPWSPMETRRKAGRTVWRQMHELRGTGTLGGKTEDDPSDADHVTRKRKGKSVANESRQWNIFHAVSPNPHHFEGIRNVRTGDRSYYRRISDTLDTEDAVTWKLAHYHSHNPSKSVAISRGQKGRYQQNYRNRWVRPAQYEVGKTTGQLGRSSKFSY